MNCQLHPQYDGDVFPKNVCCTCWDVFDVKNKVVKVGTKSFLNGMEILDTFDGQKILGAPQWLKDRMEELRRLPPPSAEQVEAQFAAAEKWRKENRTKCDRHPDYTAKKQPTNDCHDCWDVFCAQNPDQPRKLLRGERI